MPLLKSKGRKPGDFCCIIALSRNIAVAEAEADQVNGVFTAAISKPQETKPKQVKVKNAINE